MRPHERHGRECGAGRWNPVEGRVCASCPARRPRPRLVIACPPRAAGFAIKPRHRRRYQSHVRVDDKKSPRSLHPARVQGTLRPHGDKKPSPASTRSGRRAVAVARPARRVPRLADRGDARSIALRGGDVCHRAATTRRTQDSPRSNSARQQRHRSSIALADGEVSSYGVTLYCFGNRSRGTATSRVFSPLSETRLVPLPTRHGQPSCRRPNPGNRWTTRRPAALVAVLTGTLFRIHIASGAGCSLPDHRRSPSPASRPRVAHERPATDVYVQAFARSSRWF